MLFRSEQLKRTNQSVQFALVGETRRLRRFFLKLLIVAAHLTDLAPIEQLPGDQHLAHTSCLSAISNGTS